MLLSPRGPPVIVTALPFLSFSFFDFLIFCTATAAVHVTQPTHYPTVHPTLPVARPTRYPIVHPTRPGRVALCRRWRQCCLRARRRDVTLLAALEARALRVPDECPSQPRLDPEATYYVCG
jgi:hypothetical protein